MPRVAPAWQNFNGGELSPTLEGRTDFEKYKSGCYRLENFIPLVQGPAEFRAGFVAIAQTKSRTGRSWLVPFHFNQTQSYALEWGEKYVRFFYQRGQLVNPDNTAYEISTPYTANDLITTDGCFRPAIAQSNDVMWIAHSEFYPRLLERLGHTNWRCRPHGFFAGSYTTYSLSFIGPMGPYSAERTNTVYASANTGSITLTAGAGSGQVFADWMLGRTMILEPNPFGGDGANPWEPGKSITAGDLRRVDSRTYQAATTGTTGAVEPTHTAGQKSDGGVTWTFLHPGYGTCVITSITDPSHATASVLMYLPDRVVGSTHATPLFAFEAWNANDGYPDAVAFFRERLCFARGSQVWMSAPGDFFNFADRDLNNEVTADQAIILQIASDTADPVRWMRETAQGLLVGTDGGEFLIAESNPNDVLSADNVRCAKQTSYGSRAMAPIGVEHAVLFVQRGGRKLREAIYDTLSETVKSRDLTVLSEHITRGGITTMAFQQEPRCTMWLTRQDGSLLSFTYNVEQDVYGWHRHPLGNGAVAECVISIPSPDGQSDDLWMISAQSIAGKTYRYVQYLAQPYRDGDDALGAVYLDTALVFEGVSPSSLIEENFPFLGDWVGGEFYVVVNGIPMGWAAVRESFGNAFVLLPAPEGFTYPALARIVMGFPYRGLITTMRVEAGSQDGTAQGKTKRIREVWLRLLNTLGIKVGPSEDKLDNVDFRVASDSMDVAVPLFTGDKRVPYPGDYETDGRVCIVHDQPLPATIVAIMPRMETND